MLDLRSLDDIVRRSGGGDHDVARREIWIEALEVNRLAAESRGELLRLFVRAVGDENLLQTKSAEVLGRQLADFAGAEEQRLKPAEIAKDLASQLDRSIRDGDGVLANAGVGANALRNAHRLLKEELEQAVERAGSLCSEKCGAHLPADLRLADHHRVESGRDAEKMLDDIFVAQHVQVLLQIAAI